MAIVELDKCVQAAPSTDPVSVEARLEGYEYPKEWIFSKNLLAYGSVPKLVALATVSKLNIRKRYGKSGGLPTWVYDLPLKNALKAG